MRRLVLIPSIGVNPAPTQTVQFYSKNVYYHFCLQTLSKMKKPQVADPGLVMPSPSGSEYEDLLNAGKRLFVLVLGHPISSKLSSLHDRSL